MVFGTRRNNKIKKKLKGLDPDAVDDIPHENEIILGRVVNVYDGDTCKVVFLHRGKYPMKISIRIMGVDTPEISRASEEEKEAGKLVRDQVSSMILGKVVLIRMLEWDKYGGRVVGDVFLTDDMSCPSLNTFKTLSYYLIGNNYAHVYDGRKAKQGWTSEELQRIIADLRSRRVPVI